MKLRALLLERFTGCELAVLLWIALHGRVAGREAFSELPYHRGSIARARSALESAGWIVHHTGVWQLAPGRKLDAVDVERAVADVTQGRPTELPPQVTRAPATTRKTSLPATPVATPEPEPPSPAPAKPVETEPPPDKRTAAQRERDAILRRYKRK